MHRINQVLQEPGIAEALPELRCVFDGRATVPDIAVFTYQRTPVDENGDIENEFDAAPDWIIGILSSDQNQTKVTSKILHCLKQGTQMGWLLDLEVRSVLTYAPNQLPEFFEEATDVLPVPEFAKELRLTIGEIFGWLKV